MADGGVATGCIGLDRLLKGFSGTVASVLDHDLELALKLREIGFAEGDEVEVLHIAPIGATPICVRLNQTLIALRRDEAAAISIVLAP
jgi:ferrous iron transport protein A